MKINGMILAALFTANVLHAAADERVAQERSRCQIEAHFVADVFDLVTENPKVMLNGMSADDVDAFAFIRQWAGEGRSRTDLLALVQNQCTDGGSLAAKDAYRTAISNREAAPGIRLGGSRLVTGRVSSIAHVCVAVSGAVHCSTRGKAIDAAGTAVTSQP